MWHCPRRCSVRGMERRDINEGCWGSWWWGEDGDGAIFHAPTYRDCPANQLTPKGLSMRQPFRPLITVINSRTSRYIVQYSSIQRPYSVKRNMAMVWQCTLAIADYRQMIRYSMSTGPSFPYRKTMDKRSTFLTWLSHRYLFLQQIIRMLLFLHSRGKL